MTTAGVHDQVATAAYPGAMKIAVAGLGYVGLANAVILAQHHQVWAVDVDQSRVDAVKERRSPIVDADLRMEY